MQKKERQVVDLHPSEWSRAGKPEPFFGPDALLFFSISLASFPFIWLVSNVMDLLISRLGWGYGLLATAALTPVFMFIAGRLAVLSVFLLYWSGRLLRLVWLLFRVA